jgi:hypothetical protein
VHLTALYSENEVLKERMNMMDIVTENAVLKEQNKNLRRNNYEAEKKKKLENICNLFNY